MQITPQSFNVPHKVGSLKIRKVSWNDFKGKINHRLPYSAHIYWHIQYEFLENKKGHDYVVVDVKVLSKSWVLQQNKSQHLLRHEYGHYLIGCLCALQFQRKVNHVLKMPINTVYRDWVKKIFNDTLQTYLKLQKVYDQETEHRMNFLKQEQWENMITKRIKMFKDHKYDKNELSCRNYSVNKLPRIRQSAK